MDNPILTHAVVLAESNQLLKMQCKKVIKIGTTPHLTLSNVTDM